jgi:hypothetical protein
MFLRKLAEQVLNRDEFAPGIPSSKLIHPIPRVHHEKPEVWDMSLQRHMAERAGEHLDLRLIDKNDIAHSWAIPAAKLPAPGEKVLAIRQPRHTKEYSARKGTFEIGEGYGKGTVQSSGLIPVEVVRSQPGHIRFNTYGGNKEGVQEYNLIETPKGTLLHNITSTAESGVRGQGGYPIPNVKPDYKEIQTSEVKFDDPNEVHQAKLDGSHITAHLRQDRPVKFFSYRPTERASGVLEHTHKLPDYRELKAPPGLAGTVLRGELVGVDKNTGKALPAEVTGGLLNATVWNSREKQEVLGAELRPYIFDVVRYKGKLMEQAPYSEKLKVLEEVQSKIPRLAIPPMARSSDEKVDLFSQIQSGKHPLTNEGVVVWKLDSPRPTKAKFRPDVDAEVVGVTPGQGKHTGRVGALRVRLPGREAITNVGTGLSDALRTEIAKDPSLFIGRVAKVRTQQVFPSGRLRAPSFSEWHIEKGKVAGDTLDVEAYITGPSGAGKTTYVKEHYPADKFFILHSDKYATKLKDGTVSINWEKALEDGVMSGKPIVVDAYQVNRGLMEMARNKILLDPGKVKTLGQMIGRRKASLRDWKYSPEEKLERFNTKTRPVAKELGFQEKVAFTIPGHIDLTNQALDALETKGIEFTPGQRHRLEEANAAVDRESEKGLFISNKCQPFHYHSGEAPASKYLIKKYFNEAVHSENTSKALDALGIALHTTQDRWAHEVNRIKPGIRGLIAHLPFLGPKPDSLEDHPTYARKAVEDSKRLISRFMSKVHDLGKVNNQSQYFKAALTPEEQEKFKLSSVMRTLASQALKERK